MIDCVESPGQGCEAVLMLGMHRSGTSALAGTLALAGVELGKRLVPPGADNPKGFFEHDAVWRIHHDLLVELGSSWHDIRPLPAGWVQTEPARRAQERLRAEVAQDFSAVPLWGVKDPRLSRIFPLWPPLLVEMGVVPKVILALRDPLEVAASLGKRDGLGRAHALALWLRYCLDAERSTRDMSRTVQYYPDLMANWKSELERQESVLGLTLRRPFDETAIAAFLDPQLRHRPAEPDWAEMPQPYAHWCQQAFNALKSLDEQPEQARRTLEAIEAEFDAALDPALDEQVADHLRQIRRQQEAVEFLENERKKLISWGRQEEVLRASREAEIAANESLLSTTRAELEAKSAELEQVYRSRSWRWTKPVRSWLGMLRQIKPPFRRTGRTPRLSGTSEKPVNNTPDNQLDSNSGGGHNGHDVPKTECVIQTNAQMPRLLIVTPDFHGPIRNGGIGTAFAAMALTAARQGWPVTVAYALGRHSEDGSIDRWMEHYAEQGVDLVPIDEAAVADMPMVDAPLYRRNAWKIHHWLRQNQNRFDVAIFPEWMGLAYYVLLAKRQGLDYSELTVIVNTHSPESWAMEGNRRLPEWPDDIDRDFMERGSVKYADMVVSPSAYLLQWMREYRWELPEQAFVIPNLMPEKFIDPRDGQGGDAVREISRLVFFGRLEPRKGLKLFCDAVDRLPSPISKKINGIVFLGKTVVANDGFDSRAFIARRTARWEVPVQILSSHNRDEALAELKQPGTLAVIASLIENSPYTVLECLTHGVVFVASRVGGIPEMLSAADHATHLFEPNPQSLVNTLQHAAKHGIRAASLAWNPGDVQRRWMGLLSAQSRKRDIICTEPRDESAWPKVSVCLVHYDRPHLLAKALESLRHQTYPNFEVVLVDDGSPGEAAQRYLAAIKNEFEARGWQIIRQSNCYLGAARNHAARVAKGEYLLFMDDDNVALPHMLERFVTAATSSGADILTCVNMPFTGDSVPPSPERIWLPLGGAAGAGLYRNAFGDANALWRRSAFERVSGYTIDYGVGHEDWELFAEAVLSGLTLEVVPEPLYWYRVNPQGMLRAGDHWADHARSVRPYLRHNPSGLGMALAYGLYLQRMREVGSTAHPVRTSRWRAAARMLRLAADPSLRAQFLGALRAQGLRVALRRALTKAGR